MPPPCMQRPDLARVLMWRRYFGREIAAYDVQTKRCDLYGQDAGYEERVMLIYDGLHYDALAVAGAQFACSFLPLISRTACRDLS